jgi:hypothetical protein
MNDAEIAVDDEQLPDDGGAGFCPYCGQPVASIQPGMQLEDKPPF